MNFRISHLFCVTTLLAVSLVAVDYFSRQSVKVVLYQTDSWTNQERLQQPAEEDDGYDWGFRTTTVDPLVGPEGTDFVMRFRFQNGSDSIAGIVFGVFGYNDLVGESISEQNLSRHRQFEPNLEFHNLSLPWRAKTSPLDELRKHFHSIRAFP